MAGLKTIIGLAFELAVGFLLVILSGALYGNWWPLAVLLTWVLAPFPNPMFSRGSSSYDYEPNGFKDFGQFLTAIFLVTGFALPLVLAHAEVITIPATIMSTMGSFLVYATIIAYLHFFANEGDEF